MFSLFPLSLSLSLNIANPSELSRKRNRVSERRSPSSSFCSLSSLYFHSTLEYIMRGAVERKEEKREKERSTRCFKGVITTQTKSVITILANMIATLSLSHLSFSPVNLLLFAIDTFTFKRISSTILLSLQKSLSVKRLLF